MDRKSIEEGKARSPKGKTGANAIRGDAAGQYGEGRAAPNPGGLVSANPVALSGDGDATTGAGHGRDRDPKGPKAG